MIGFKIPQLKLITVEVLVHRKIGGTALDGSDAVYSKGVPLLINLKVGRDSCPTDYHLMRLAKIARPGLIITKLLTKF